MARRRHMAMLVRGALGKTNRELERNLGGAIECEGRMLTTGAEIRAALERELSQGHELVPMCASELCPNFNPKTGCPGHDLKQGEVN